MKAISADGLKVNLAVNTLPAGYDDPGGQLDDDGPTNNVQVNYRGIPGSIICGGNDCKVSATPTSTLASLQLTGSWYFAPTDKNEEYVRDRTVTTDRVYIPDNLYVKYGYWLSGTENNVASVSVYAYSAGASTAEGTGYELGVDATPALTDTKGEYIGNAVGISSVKEYDSQGNVVAGSLQSGHFTADVELTVTFQTATSNASISGSLENFEGGAVDSTWRVDLQSNTGDAFNNGQLTTTDGKTVGLLIRRKRRRRRLDGAGLRQ